MEVSLLGHKINILNAIIFILVGFAISTSTVCSCRKMTFEDALKLTIKKGKEQLEKLV